MPADILVVDANILIRGVLGVRVRGLLEHYADVVRFFAPDIAFADAHEHLPRILHKRGMSPTDGLAVLETLHRFVEDLDVALYALQEAEARQRLRSRDEEDWPILASALVLGSPIWTEDVDFFGAGVATWTTDRVDIFLERAGVTSC